MTIIKGIKKKDLKRLIKIVSDYNGKYALLEIELKKLEQKLMENRIIYYNFITLSKGNFKERERIRDEYDNAIAELKKLGIL